MRVHPIVIARSAQQVQQFQLTPGYVLLGMFGILVALVIFWNSWRLRPLFYNEQNQPDSSTELFNLLACGAIFIIAMTIGIALWRLTNGFGFQAKVYDWLNPIVFYWNNRS